MKKVGISFGVVFLLVLQLVVFRSFWLTRVGSFLIYQDTIAPADAILVLGGGRRERVVQGLELWKKHYGSCLLFTGEWDEQVFTDPTHWALEAQKLAVSYGVTKDNIIPILDSQSTRDDATLSKEVCFKRHFRSLIVVSEPYHTERAHFVFEKVYKNSGIKIMIYPVQNSWYKRNTWWKSKGGFWDTNIEYQKFVYYLLKGYLL
jgi:uncharacterized SAM-binding protein YcdF (DUF218 family)